jgi:hypothetical protein
MGRRLSFSLYLSLRTKSSGNPGRVQKNKYKKEHHRTGLSPIYRNLTASVALTVEMPAMKYIMATGSNVNNTGTFLARPSATQTNVRRTNKMGKSLDRRRFFYV